MRVTNGMMADTLLRNLHSNLRKMTNSQEKLSTGRKINRPSDDPAGLAEALTLRSQKNELEKYISNVENTSAWLESTDSALGELGDVLVRLKELTIYGASDALPQESRVALAEEVKELKDHIFQVANSDQGQKHIFGGQNTIEEPFVKVDNEDGTYKVEYVGNESELKVDINSGVSITKNISGVQAFGDPNSGESIFDFMDELYDNLMAGDTQALSSETLGKLDGWIDTNLENRGRSWSPYK